MTATATAPEPPNALREQLTATDKRVELIALDSLNRRGLQLRETTDPDAVARYADAYKAGENLPPIVVFRDPTDDILHLADGHHRVAAAKRAQLTELHAIVKKGDRRAAILYAAGANGQHGLPLTNADKRKIVTLLLADAEWRAWSNREIGRCARVSEALVRQIRKEVGAEVDAIKRKDGSVQKPRNAEAKKPKQQDLFDQPDPAISERYAAVLPLLGCEGSGFEAMHATKRAILAACYALVPSGQTDPGTTRDRLRTITGLPPDTHLDGLMKTEYLECNDARTDWRLTRSGRFMIDALLVKAGKILAYSRPTTTEEPGVDDAEFTNLVARQHTLADAWKQVVGLKHCGYDAMRARLLVTMADWPATAEYPVTRAWLAQRTHTNLRAVDEAIAGLTGIVVETPSTNEFYISDALQREIAAILDPKTIDATKTVDHVEKDGDSITTHYTDGSFETIDRSGPEELRIKGDDDHADEPAPAAAAPPPASAAQLPAPAADDRTRKLRPLGLRRVDAQRDLIAVELGKGKPKWTGTDNDLLLLALICGVPTRTQAWIDASRAQARELFIDALRAEVSERIRSGEAVDGRRWPCLAELCRLWGLDFASIEIRAERAVPE